MVVIIVYEKNIGSSIGGRYRERRGLSVDRYSKDLWEDWWDWWTESWCIIDSFSRYHSEKYFPQIQE